VKCSPPTYIRGYQDLCLKESRKDKEGRKEGRKERWKEGKNERRIRRKKEDATNSIAEDLL
jgi:hypothetical protein